MQRVAVLKLRIFTAIILVPLFVALVLGLTARQFSFLIGFISIWCSYEWAALMGIQSKFPKILAALVMSLFMASTLYLIEVRSLSIISVLYISAIWWLIAILLVISYPRSSRVWGKSKVPKAFMGLITLIPWWIALSFIRIIPNGEYIVLFLFVLIWTADSGAYFAGRLFGKHKLLPEVSPGKTWEGFFGAIVATGLLATLTAFFLKLNTYEFFMFIMLSVLTVVISVFGDLFESMIKRQAGVKDSGTILPGHGGALDRLDSIFAAAPIFALGLYLIKEYAIS